MDEKQRYDSGMATRRKVLGKHYVDKSTAGVNDFNREFQEYITLCAWGQAWTRPHFDERTRRILVIGTMVALGHWEELAIHIRGARRNGLTDDEIKEVLLQCAIYCGVPAANHAFGIAQQVLAEP